VGGDYLRRMREWSRFADDDDFVFADQYGVRVGKPVYMDSLRLQGCGVLRQMGFNRFTPDICSQRHFFATQRLAAGAPPLPHSRAIITATTTPAVTQRP
jgi:hypothetical protein